MAKEKGRIEFISAGFRDILLSEGTKEFVAQTCDQIKDRANASYGGDGFKSNVEKSGYAGGRWIGFVKTTDKASLKAESENKALTGAIT